MGTNLFRKACFQRTAAGPGRAGSPTGAPGRSPPSPTSTCWAGACCGARMILCSRPSVGAKTQPQLRIFLEVVQLQNATNLFLAACVPRLRSKKTRLVFHATVADTFDQILSPENLASSVSEYLYATPNTHGSPPGCARSIEVPYSRRTCRLCCP